MVFDPTVTASVITDGGDRIVLVRMTVSELVDSYLGVDRQQTPTLANEPFITLAGKSIKRRTENGFRMNLRNVGTVKSARVRRHAGWITVWERL